MFGFMYSILHVCCYLIYILFSLALTKSWHLQTEGSNHSLLNVITKLNILKYGKTHTICLSLLAIMSSLVKILNINTNFTTRINHLMVTYHSISSCQIREQLHTLPVEQEKANTPLNLKPVSF